MINETTIEEAITTQFVEPSHLDGAIIEVSLPSGIKMFCAWPRLSNNADVHFAAVEQFCKMYPELGPASAYNPGMVRGGFVWVKTNDTNR